MENFKTRYDRGTVGMNDFFKRITERNEEETILQKSYYDPIKKQKLVIFGSNQKKKSYWAQLSQ